MSKNDDDIVKEVLKKTKENEKRLDNLSRDFLERIQENNTRVDDYENEVSKLLIYDEQIRENLNTQTNEINKQRQSIDKQKEAIDRQKEEINKQKEDIKEQKNDLIQYFGLFVAIFTAISIDIQLLKFAQNVWSIAGLMLMVNTAPLFFFWLIRSFLEWNYVTRVIDNGINGRQENNLKSYFLKRMMLFIFFFVVIFASSMTLMYIGTINGQPKTVIERVIKTENSVKTQSIKTEVNEQSDNTSDIKNN